MNSIPFEYFQQEVKGTNSHAIQDLFSASASDTHFQVISKTSNSSTAVYQEPLSFKSVLACILPVTPFYSEISSVKLEILPDKKSVLVILRSLTGENAICRQIIEDFKSKLRNFSKPNIFFFEKSFQSESITYIEQPDSYEKVKPESQQNDFSIDRALTSPDFQYSEAIEEISDSLKTGVNDAIFQSIDCKVEKMAQDVFMKYPRCPLQYCRSLIEKKIYSKIYPRLLEHYKELNGAVDQKFEQKRAKLVCLASGELLKVLQVSSKFLLTGISEPYSDAKIVLRRFNKLKTPLDKINCLIAAVACMKACVVEYWKGGVEIQAMDDELPVLMFLLLTCEICYPSAELTILSHYVSGRLENESRIILNFNSAVSYLSMHLN